MPSSPIGRATSSSSSSTACATTRGSPPSRRRSRALGPVERRWSYATWTAPSHYNLLMGLLPAHEPRRRSTPPSTTSRTSCATASGSASQGMEFKRLLPSIFLPTYLKHTLGYRTHARVSMPVLNPHTVDQPRLRQLRADAEAQRHGGDARRSCSFDERRAVLLPAQRRRDPLPVRAARRGPEQVAADLRRPRRLQAPRRRRRTTRRRHASSSTRRGCASCGRARSTPSSYLDGVFARLFDLLPDDTWVIVTSDHGELFGEERFFGHGPIMHEKVLEVPFVEGRVP